MLLGPASWMPSKEGALVMGLKLGFAATLVGSDGAVDGAGPGPLERPWCGAPLLAVLPSAESNGMPSMDGACLCGVQMIDAAYASASAGSMSSNDGLYSWFCEGEPPAAVGPLLWLADAAVPRGSGVRILASTSVLWMGCAEDGGTCMHPVVSCVEIHVIDTYAHLKMGVVWLCMKRVA